VKGFLLNDCVCRSEHKPTPVKLYYSNLTTFFTVPAPCPCFCFSPLTSISSKTAHKQPLSVAASLNQEPLHITHPSILKAYGLQWPPLLNGECTQVLHVR